MAYLETAIGITIMYLPYCRNILTPKIFKYWEISQILSRTCAGQGAPGFLQLLLSANICMCICVCVRPEAINNYWHDVV